MDYSQVEAEVRRAVEQSSTSRDAMERVVGILKERLPHYTWVGVYQVVGDELVLGPYLGKPSPHTRIPLGRGICGAAATEKATIVPGAPSRTPSVAGAISSATLPRCVNLNAFDSRFFRICCSRLASV